MKSSIGIAVDSQSSIESEGLWLNGRTWDLTFISLSASLVFLPFFAYEFFKYALGFESLRMFVGVPPGEIADFSRNSVNALVALLIGGPHMYATFTRTFLDSDFRRRHVWFLLGSLALPVIVILLGVSYFRLLITVFFLWASVHILHQIVYILDCYNAKATNLVSRQSRLLDFAVVFSSLYPISIWRMVNDDFEIGQIKIIFPDALLIQNNPTLGWLVFLFAMMIFGIALTLWIWKSYREYVRGEFHAPKTLLLGLTVVVAFFVPMYHELDISFQGFNTWHSFQYLGLTLYINQLRQQRQGIGTPLISKMSESGKGWRFYLFTVACAVVALGLITLLIVNKDTLGLTFDQCYYIVVLSFLLMHYFHDHLLFTKTEAMVK
jgi:hypothetical protein